MLTPERCQGARSLLNWTRERLAEESGLDAVLIAEFELDQRPLDAVSLAALTGALEAAGIGFAATNDDEITLRERLDFG